MEILARCCFVQGRLLLGHPRRSLKHCHRCYSPSIHMSNTTPENSSAERLLEWESTLVKELQTLRFPSPVSFIYSPLEYAWPLHEEYVRRYYRPTARVLFVGMNPGPFGMVQSGIPFGDVVIVKEWLDIRGDLVSTALPERVHPKRPILGLNCPRREVSGQRFWGWARQGWHSSDGFFSWAFVYNYCPLAFLSSSGKNISLEQLREGNSKTELLRHCNRCLLYLVDDWKPLVIFGLGKFAYQMCDQVVGHLCPVYMLPHPSPANPKSGAYWSQWSAVANDIQKADASILYSTSTTFQGNKYVQ